MYHSLISSLKCRTRGRLTTLKLHLITLDLPLHIHRPHNPRSTATDISRRHALNFIWSLQTWVISLLKVGDFGHARTGEEGMGMLRRRFLDSRCHRLLALNCIAATLLLGVFVYFFEAYGVTNRISRSRGAFFDWVTEEGFGRCLNGSVGLILQLFLCGNICDAMMDFGRLGWHGLKVEGVAWSIQVAVAVD